MHDLLPKEVIESLCQESKYDFRNRLLTPAVTVFHMLNAAISPEKSFQSAWHNIGEIGGSDVLSKARKRLPLEVWEMLHGYTAKQIDKEFSEEGRWRGHRVVGVDGSCVSMSDEEELTKAFGKSGSKGSLSRFPVGRVVFGFLLNLMTVVGHRVGAYRISENALFSELTEDLQSSDLIIGDRQFAGAKRYVEYKRAGLEFITRAHQRDSLKVVEVLGKDDFIVQLPIPKVYLRKDPGLPASIRVRMIKGRAKVRGRKTTIWLATSLLEARKYPAGEIKLLYKKRWKVEGLIGEIKIWLGADILRSKSEEGIRKELYARLIAFNLTHWLILRSCKKHNKSPEATQRISVSATLRLTAAYSLKMGAADDKGVVPLYEELLDKISRCNVAYRGGRIEPRMKKRDQKHYPILKISRAEWRSINEKVYNITKVPA